MSLNQTSDSGWSAVTRNQICCVNQALLGNGDEEELLKVSARLEWLWRKMNQLFTIFGNWDSSGCFVLKGQPV